MAGQMRSVLDKKRQTRDSAAWIGKSSIIALLRCASASVGRGGSSSHVFHSVARHRALCAERCGSQDADRQAAALLGCTTPLRARDEQIYVV